MDEVTLAEVFDFVADRTTPSIRRQRSRACRSFYMWTTQEGVYDAAWWTRIPSLNQPATPQATATVEAVVTTQRIAGENAEVSVGRGH